MSRNWEQLLQLTKRMPIRSPELPRCCPYCHVRLVWGWMEEECCGPEGAICYQRRIPRPDQTLFCPQCEERILN